MSNTSSRILRENEVRLVTPLVWQTAEAEPMAPPVECRPTPTVPEQEEEGPKQTLEQERLEKEAYQRGFTEGKSVGREQSAAEVQPVLGRLTRSLAELSSLRARIRKEAESDLVKLSISVARRVLHRELTIDPESISGIIHVALEKLESREMSRVRVHPDQEPAVRTALDRFNERLNIEIVPDPSLERGDILLETSHGTLDASIEVQLREIERGFADRLRR